MNAIAIDPNAVKHVLKGTPEEFLGQLKFPYLHKEGDRNLIAEARAIFLKHLDAVGAGDRIKFFDEDDNIVQAQPLAPELQRFKLTVFMNSQYSMLVGPITQHRRFLLQIQDIDTLIRMIDTYHAPTMAANGLPRSYY